MTRYCRLALLATVLLCGCGDDGSPAGPDPGERPTPTPTAAGSPDGAPSAAVIGPAGGTLAASDGLFRLAVPAGALAADTEIGVQPITNTAWGGCGKGYRLTPEGLRFSVPIDLVFALDDSLLAGCDPSLADVALHRPDGVWGVLKHRTVDLEAGTVTATTTHFSDYSMIEGVQILPARAQVQTGGSVALSVRFCSRDTFEDGEDVLAALLITCESELAPLGDFDHWSVNGLPGGNATLGTVSPASGPQATFHAPTNAPTPDVVAVSVETTYEGMHALLVSSIRILGEERWVGTALVYGTDSHAFVDVVWNPVGTFGTIRFFAPSGTVHQVLESNADCSVLSFAPDTSPIGELDGTLLVDYATDPPTFQGGAGTQWIASSCVICTGDESPTCGDVTVAVGWFAAKGVVQEDGTRIAAILVDDQGDPVGEYDFHRESVPPPIVP